MNKSIRYINYLLLALALPASQNAFALKVYQWTDAEGVVHFSDTPPPDATASAVSESELFNLNGDAAATDEYSIVNQLEQMVAWRRQAEEDQRAWKQLQLEEERLAQESQANQPPADIYTDTYYPLVYGSPAYYGSYPVNFPRYTRRFGHHYPGHYSGGGHQGQHQQMTTGYYKLK